MRNGYEWIFTKFILSGENIFCLSHEIKNEYLKFGANPNKLFVIPNGADENNFIYKQDNILNPNKSICLGKVEPRKRQSQIQDLDAAIDFVGNCIDSNFNQNKKNYLGEWSKQKVKSSLTEYGNLILLSDGEAHPLVCVEALMAGLGLVVSEQASHNLDRTKPFITILNDEEIRNHSFLKSKIEENRNYSIGHREEIRTYALENFAWKVIVDKYLDTIQKL
jgi:glycosyltransferase involved in cell wall biosynthesis